MKKILVFRNARLLNRSFMLVSGFVLAVLLLLLANISVYGQKGGTTTTVPTTAVGVSTYFIVSGTGYLLKPEFIYFKDSKGVVHVKPKSATSKTPEVKVVCTCGAATGTCKLQTKNTTAGVFFICTNTGASTCCEIRVLTGPSL